MAKNTPSNSDTTVITETTEPVNYSFPEWGVSVTAKSLDEAIAKAKKLTKEIK